MRTPTSIGPLSYYKEGQYSEAIADYSVVINLNPEHPSAYFNRAHAYFQKGQHEEVIADCNTIKLRPRSARASTFGACSYHVLGNCDQAISDYATHNQAKPPRRALLRQSGHLLC